MGNIEIELCDKDNAIINGEHFIRADSDEAKVMAVSHWTVSQGIGVFDFHELAKVSGSIGRTKVYYLGHGLGVHYFACRDSQKMQLVEKMFSFGKPWGFNLKLIYMKEVFHLGI